MIISPKSVVVFRFCSNVSPTVCYHSFVRSFVLRVWKRWIVNFDKKTVSEEVSESIF